MQTMAGRIVTAALGLNLAMAGPGAALIPGGDAKKSDCYAEWQVTAPEVVPTKGRTKVDCQDGDARCDVDGAVNGSCTVGISICVPFVDNVGGCTPQTVDEIKLNKKSQKAALQLPTLPASAAVCGGATLQTLTLQKNGAKPSKPLKLGMTAKASVKPKSDKDTLAVRCVPNAGAGQCPANASGGPSSVTFTVPSEGTDLDNGWTGNSHNFPIVSGARLQVCLQGCDATANPVCTEDEAPTEQVNGAFFGSPVPLLAAGLPVCLANRFSSPKIAGGLANLQTGGFAATVNLLSSVYLSTSTQICPRCSGSDIGRTGTCDSGPSQGQACRTGGVIEVGNAPGNRRYTTSADCLPLGSPVGILTIALPLTTTSSMLAGPRPCGASQDSGCSGPCAATCTGAACVRTTDSQCIDAKGGISQLCCSDDTTRPCFPTAGGGAIVRTGAATAPAPPWPDPTYPKTGTETFVATFCEPATSASIVNNVTGLPGPGALILPASSTWER